MRENLAKNWKPFNLLEVAPLSKKRVSKFNGGKEYVATADLDFNRISNSALVTYENRASRADLVLPLNGVMFAKMKDTVKVLAGSPADVNKIFSTGFYIHEPIANLSQKYLYFYFLSNEFNRVKNHYCKGATMSALTLEGLKKIQIPLPINQSGEPDLAEQQRIVCILEQAEELRQRRDIANQKMEEIAPALFVKMFGTPQMNPKKWEIAKLKDLITEKPKYGLNKPAAELDSEVRYVRITDITDNGSLKLEQKVGVNISASEKEEFKLALGDIVFARSGATVGKTYLYNPTDGICVYAGYLIKFKINRQIANPLFVFNYTKTKEYKAWVLSKQRSVGQPNINAVEYSNLEIPLPPLKLQDKFADLVSKIYLQIDKQRYEQNIISELFDSIIYKAFIGQLLPVVTSAKEAKWTSKEWFNLKQGIASVLERWMRGEMVVDKLLYLVQEVKGVNFGLAFARHNFGPYDSKVKLALYAKDKFFVKQMANGYPVFAISQKAKDQLLKYNSSILGQSRAAVKELASEIQSLTSPQIEIIATVCKIIEDIKSTDLPEIQSELNTWKDKSTRFSPQQVSQARDFIIAHNWHLKLLKGK